MISKTLVALCLALSSVQGDSMADARELQAFRLGLALVEGGGKVDYTQGNSTTGAYGAYQFVPKWWDWYSTEAGLAGANIEDPVAQNKVAAWHFNYNFDKYGDWMFPAIAHFAGPDDAKLAYEEGFDAVKNKKDDTGVTVEQYVNKVMQRMEEQMQLMSEIDTNVATLGLPQSDTEYYKGAFDPTKIVEKEAAQILDAITNGMSDNGRKKFPMNTKSDFKSQVPKAAGSYEGAKIKTDIGRGIKIQ